MALDRSLPDRAEVVIIGGGVMGTSAAFHLAEAGVTDVVLLEADQLSCGSTSKSAGGVRLQFSDEINIALALRSMDAFERFADRPGADIALQQVGYLFLLTDPDDVVAFEKNTALQNSMGVPSRMISAAEAGRLSTLAHVDDVLAASICMRDGHATPDAVVLGYATAAREMGVEIATQCPVTGIDVDGGDITGVRTARGTISTSTVICVAGAWSPSIAAMCGVDLPVKPVARPIWYTEPMPDRPAHVPMTIDFTTGFYFHTEGPGLLFGMADPEQPAGFDSPMRPDWLEVVGDVVAHRAPALLDVGIAGGWHGYYETTPDHNALIGEASGVSRFIYATGFSGHGFLMGPAVGEVLRDLVMGHAPAVDVSGFDVERFKGETRPEHNVV
ncbi:MAG TPA: FAD-binding oxidoreductase [Ilumatobacteraceae bacterium]|jgi:sarcosine oxidase subunit beta|nr:FAD-binding oxidoreductase [Ilumatobacteraceae bacterium]